MKSLVLIALFNGNMNMLPIQFFNADITQLQTCDAATVQQVFQFLAQESKIEFNYPQGGCQQRAQIMSLMLSKKFNINHYKVWLFAPLTMHVHDTRTLFINDKNHITPNNIVEWNYHVAPVVRVSDGNNINTMVIDPSINSNAPMLLNNWFAAINNSSASEYTFTMPFVYFFNGCYDNKGNLTPLFDGSFFEYNEETKDNLIVEKGLALNDMVMQLYHSRLKGLLNSSKQTEDYKAGIKNIFGNATALDVLIAQNLSGGTPETTQRYAVINYNDLMNEARQIFYERLSYWTKVIDKLFE